MKLNSKSAHFSPTVGDELTPRHRRDKNVGGKTAGFLFIHQNRQHPEHTTYRYVPSYCFNTAPLDTHNFFHIWSPLKPLWQIMVNLTNGAYLVPLLCFQHNLALILMQRLLHSSHLASSSARSEGQTSLTSGFHKDPDWGGNCTHHQKRYYSLTLRSANRNKYN